MGKEKGKPKPEEESPSKKYVDETDEVWENLSDAEKDEYIKKGKDALGREPYPGEWSSNIKLKKGFLNKPKGKEEEAGESKEE